MMLHFQYYQRNWCISRQYFLVGKKFISDILLIQWTLFYLVIKSTNPLILVTFVYVNSLVWWGINFIKYVSLGLLSFCGLIVLGANSCSFPCLVSNCLFSMKSMWWTFVGSSHCDTLLRCYWHAIFCSGGLFVKAYLESTDFWCYSHATKNEQGWLGFCID